MSDPASKKVVSMERRVGRDSGHRKLLAWLVVRQMSDDPSDDGPVAVPGGPGGPDGPGGPMGPRTVFPMGPWNPGHGLCRSNVE